MRIRSTLCLVVMLSLVSLATLAGESKLFLWEVKGEKATVHLLGSMHVAKEGIYPLDPVITEAWEASPALAVEVNLDTVDMMGLQQKLLTRGMYGEGKTLKDSVAKETWALLESYLDARGMTTAGFNSMRPWFLAMVLTVTEMARCGYQENLGIDRHFLDLAKKAEKSVWELESGEFQLELLSGFETEMQELFLVSTLKEMENFPDRMTEIVEAWKTGDTAAVERLINESAEEDKRLVPVLEQLVYQRNEDMAAKIAGWLDEGKSCFVVVGAAHLVGERSIAQLLGKLDFKTVQLAPHASAVSR